MQKSRRQNAPGLARNHHFVPQWLLRQWRNESGRLWVAKRLRGQWDIRQRSVRRSFSQDGLYHFLPAAPDASPDDLVERRLSSIEGTVARVWKSLRRTLDRGAPSVVLDADSEGWLKLHIWLQLTRTPHFFQRVREQLDYGLPEIQSVVARVEAAGGHVTDAERQAIEDGSLLEECLQNARAANVIMQDFNSRSWRILMERRRLVVGRAVNNIRFVISDDPVMYCNSMPSMGSTLGNPHLEVWTPFSPRYALGLVNPSDVPPGAVVSLNSDKVREWNESQVRDCRLYVAGRTYSDLTSLVTSCEA